ncbi:MAG TPA: GNAT family protein [Thermoleophilaceae bacterium]
MRVALRDFRSADAHAVHRWFNTPQVIEGLVEQRTAFGEEEARRWVERAARAEGADRKWAIDVDERPEAAGFSALYGLGGQAAPELGILIGDPELWGRGVGSEAQRLTIERAFGELGAHRVFELILADNARARRVVERLGFELEGMMRGHVQREGRLLDVAVYGLSPEDFSG